MMSAPAETPNKSNFVELASAIDVDSALFAAMRDPRERLALLRLEQVFCDLIRSETDGWVEVGGPMNGLVLWPSRSPTSGAPLSSSGNNATSGMRQTTFQRCILHRLADRFEIVREQGSLLQTPSVDTYNNIVMSTAGSIRLIKLPQSKIPSLLLCDLDPSAYEEQPSADGTSNTDPSRPPKAQKPRKMKIMKRQGSNSANSSSSKHNDNTQSAGSSNGIGDRHKTQSDKEKAYAEARARIFQEQQDEEKQQALLEDALANTRISERSGSDSATPSYHRSTSIQSASSVGSVNSNAPPIPTTDPSNLPQQQLSGTAADPSRKAVLRNYAEEANDPDFQRGRVVVPISPGYGPAAWVHPSQGMVGYAVPRTPHGVAASYGAPVLGSNTSSSNPDPTAWPSLGDMPPANTVPSNAATTSFAAAVTKSTQRQSSSSTLTATAPAWTPKGHTTSSST